jgi:saccharopine dehydrogenase (NAD+, L-lysine-forming)
MHIAVIGAGAMGTFVARELADGEPHAGFTIIDADPARAAAVAEGLDTTNARPERADAKDQKGLAKVLEGAVVAVNAAQYDVNIPVMKACLAAGCHYLDLGGMYHTTRRQLELSEAFRAKDLTAVLGMGAAPGMTNLLARRACDQLDAVDTIEASFAAAALDTPHTEVFVPPYSIRTLMQEFCDESVQFIDGEYRVQPALAGRKAIQFPPPIGVVDCVFTLHSEPATLPEVFAAKGVREVTWRLGLPPALEEPVRAFAAAGLGGTEPIEFDGRSIVPVEFLAAVVDRNAGNAVTSEHAFTEYGCLRVEAQGTRGGAPVTLALECMFESTGTSPDVAGIMTGTPCALAALMLARGEVARPGAHGPESAIPPLDMIHALGQRGFDTTQMEHTTLL